MIHSSRRHHAVFKCSFPLLPLVLFVLILLVDRFGHGQSSIEKKERFSKHDRVSNLRCVGLRMGSLKS